MKIIDIHTHGIEGRDTRTTSTDRVLDIAAVHGASGVSGILLAVYPSSLEAMRDWLETIRKAMEQQKTGAGSRRAERIISPHSGPPARKYASARILGVSLEGPFINPVQCGALSAKYCRRPSLSHFLKLVEGYEEIVRIVTIAPELPGSPRLIREISSRGVIVQMGHSDATYAEAEAGFRAGARGITHLFNAMRGLHHREPGIAGFGLVNREVYIEVIADPHHLHTKTLALIFRTKPSGKIVLVSDTVRESRKAAGRKAVTDSKGMLLGGSMTVAAAAERLIKMGYSQDLVMRCVTRNPKSYLAHAK